MSLSISSEVKQDISFINDVPEARVDLVINLVSLALQGELKNSDATAVANDMNLDDTVLQSGIDALCYVISELVRISLPKEVTRFSIYNSKPFECLLLRCRILRLLWRI